MIEELRLRHAQPNILKERETPVLMVPLSERRHRIYDNEIPEVVKGLVLRLRQLLEEGRNSESAENAFRALYRLLEGRPGRPRYPEFTWSNVQLYIEKYLPEKFLP